MVRRTEKYQTEIDGYRYNVSDKRKWQGHTGIAGNVPASRVTTFKPVKRGSPEVEGIGTSLSGQMKSPVMYRKLSNQERRENRTRNIAAGFAGGYLGAARARAIAESVGVERQRPEYYGRKLKAAFHDEDNLDRLEANPFKRVGRTMKRSFIAADPMENIKYGARRARIPLALGGFAAAGAALREAREQKKPRYITQYKDSHQYQKVGRLPA